jgi:hypothetical protein
VGETINLGYYQQSGLDFRRQKGNRFCVREITNL